jgi:peroxiredoxin
VKKLLEVVNDQSTNSPVERYYMLEVDLSDSGDQMRAIVFFVSVGVLAMFFIYRQAIQVGPPGVISAGQKAPDFTLKFSLNNQDGESVKLSDYRGRLVFLHFWASWCPPCVAEAQDIEKLKNAMNGRPFQMLPISIDIEADAVREFDNRYDVTLPALLDPGQQIARGLYRITGPPETFLIGADGIVLRHIIGPAAWSDPRILASLESMLPES